MRLNWPQLTAHRSCGVTKTPVLGLNAKGLASCSGSCPGDSLKVNLHIA